MTQTIRKTAEALRANDCMADASSMPSTLKCANPVCGDFSVSSLLFSVLGRDSVGTSWMPRRTAEEHPVDEARHSFVRVVTLHPRSVHGPRGNSLCRHADHLGQVHAVDDELCEPEQVDTFDDGVDVHVLDERVDVDVVPNECGQVDTRNNSGNDALQESRSDPVSRGEGFLALCSGQALHRPGGRPGD